VIVAEQRREKVPMRHLRPLAALAAALALATAGCSSGGDSGKTTLELVDLRGQAEGYRPEVTVSVKDNVFIPRGIRVDPGTKVTFTNEGRSAHDILASDPDQDYGAKFGVAADEFGPGASWSFTFTKPGVYRIYCSLHGTADAGMTGVVVVGDVAFDGKIGGKATTGTRGGTLRVPADYPTIQEAVDAAKPGSLVLVAPGVYKEAVAVTTPRLVIRGERRNDTILDGEFTRDNGFKVLADGVAIENITARNFTRNGFFWTGVKGYRGSYLNAIRNGDYGIYAFDSVNGQFDHDYASGSPDAGFYIGQCFPCNAVITDSIAEWNGLGYSGTNAGGDLYIVNSVWRNNRAGIVPNSGTGEANPPQHGTTIVGNTVYGNNNAKTAAIEIAELAIGNGILVAGGNENVVERNLVYDHDLVGIAVIPLPEKVISPDNPNAVNFDARRNVVRDNVLADNRAADIALVTSIDDAKDAGENCFTGNEAKTSLPERLEPLVPCGAPAAAGFETDINRFAALLGAEKPVGADYKTAALPAPPPLDEMPDAPGAPPRPADRDVPVRVDLAAIRVPSRR
jgi:plastocyanin